VRRMNTHDADADSRPKRGLRNAASFVLPHRL
jgi:hypothetical protein